MARSGDDDEEEEEEEKEFGATTEAAKENLHKHRSTNTAPSRLHVPFVSFTNLSHSSCTSTCGMKGITLCLCSRLAFPQAPFLLVLLVQPFLSLTAVFMGVNPLHAEIILL